MKTKALISFAVTAKLICVFVFVYAKSRFSHDAAHIVKLGSMGLYIFFFKFCSDIDRGYLLEPPQINSIETLVITKIQCFIFVTTKDQCFYLNYHKFSIKSYVLDVF